MIKRQRPRSSVLRLWLAVVALAVAGLVMTQGPYAALTEVMAPRAPFEEQSPQSVTEIARVFDALGEEGRALYRRYQRWDLLVIAINMALLGLWLQVAGRGLMPRWRVSLAGAPTVADLLENVLLSRLLAQFPDLADASVAWVRAATLAKQGCFALVVVTAVVLTLLQARRAWRRRATAASRSSPA